MQTTNLIIEIDYNLVIKNVINNPYLDKFLPSTLVSDYLPSEIHSKLRETVMDTIMHGYSYGIKFKTMVKGTMNKFHMSFFHYEDSVFCISLNENENTINTILLLQHEILKRNTKIGEKNNNVSNTKSSIYDELSLMNNDLIRTKRSLQQKNFELHQLNKKLEEISLVDFLTEIPNRRKFFLDSYELINYTDITLVLMDFNNFKLCNDILGHDVGDQLLKTFAIETNLYLKDMGTLYRLGGDEFAIILTDNIFDINLYEEHIDQILHTFLEEISIAIGVKHITQEEFANVSKIEDMMSLADKQMYSHKKKKKKKG